MTKKDGTLKQKLEELDEIIEWFQNQDELDLEIALQKIKIATVLIGVSKNKLGDIQNSFTEIKKSSENK